MNECKECSRYRIELENMRYEHQEQERRILLLKRQVKELKEENLELLRAKQQLSR